jgi:hypothetical protein
MSRKSSLPLIVMGFFALLAVLLGIYAGSYVALSRAFPVTTTALDSGPTGLTPVTRQMLIRRFSARWLAVVFQPAAWVESRIRREEVQLEPTGEPDLVY